MANFHSLKKFPYLLFDKRQYHKDLSCIRESYGEVNEQLLEVCRKMQKQFDPKDLQQAAHLAAELKTLKACEEKLEELEELGDAVSVIEGEN